MTFDLFTAVKTEAEQSLSAFTLEVLDKCKVRRVKGGWQCWWASGGVGCSLLPLVAAAPLGPSRCHKVTGMD